MSKPIKGKNTAAQKLGAAHTPGPWEFLPGQDNEVIRPGDPVAGSIYSPSAELHLARVWSDIDKGDTEANGRLLAAAPELLAALERIAANTCCDKCQEAALVACAAIAKAKGKA